MEHADSMNPFSFVEKKEPAEEHEKKLKLPLQFSYNDGLIEKISFDTDDDVNILFEIILFLGLVKEHQTIGAEHASSQFEGS